MPNRDGLYLVDERALSDVLLKTLKAKELLDKQKEMTISDATKKAGLSRGAFYKYKDLIKPFYNLQSGLKYTFMLVVSDVTGILSEILKIMAKAEVSVLTINQSIPINGIANITITIDTIQSKIKIDKLIERLTKIEGINKVDVLSGGN